METRLEPLLSDEYLGTLAPDPDWPDGPEWYPSSMQVRNIYEEARSKDAELIQMLVDTIAWQQRLTLCLKEDGTEIESEFLQEALDAAAAAGFKPSK